VVLQPRAAPFRALPDGEGGLVLEWIDAARREMVRTIEVSADGQVEAVEYATLEWVHWFNNVRLLEPIGNIPPAELEKAYYNDLHSLPVAAGLT